MAQSQLQEAYALIKQGRKQEALSLIESALRSDRQNKDAWWLLANATDDPTSQRKALENVIRLGGNPSRVEKAQQMLSMLQQDDPFDDFDDFQDPYAAPASSSFQYQKSSPAVASGPTVVKEKKGPSCWTVGLAVVGVLTLISCIGLVALLTVGGNFLADILGDALDFINAPTEYTDEGMLESGQSVEGQIRSGDDRIGYSYRASSGETVRIVIESINNTGVAPFVFVYGLDGVLIGGSANIESSQNNFEAQSEGRYTVTFPENGEYLLVVRPVFGFGSPSDYRMTINKQ